MAARSRLWSDRSRKPVYGAVEIDWSHPLAQGLVSAWVLNEGGGPGSDLCAPVSGSPASWPLSPRGIVASGDWTPMVSRPALDLPASAAFSLSAYLRCTADAYAELLRYRAFYTDATTCGGYALGFSDSSAPPAAFYFLHRNNNQVAGIPDSPAAITSEAGRVIDQWYAVTGSATLGSEAKLYVDGVLRVTNTSVGSAVAYDPGGGGLRVTATSGQMLYGYIHARRLTDSEALWLAHEPYAMLSPVTRRRYVWAAAVAPDPVVSLSRRATHHYRRDVFRWKGGV